MTTNLPSGIPGPATPELEHVAPVPMCECSIPQHIADRVGHAYNGAPGELRQRMGLGGLPLPTNTADLCLVALNLLANVLASNGAMPRPMTSKERRTRAEKARKGAKQVAAETIAKSLRAAKRKAAKASPKARKGKAAKGRAKR